jgi:predicted nucleic acid-binding protein
LPTQERCAFVPTIPGIPGKRAYRIHLSITVAELSVGAHLAQRKNALEKTLQLLEITEIIDLDTKIAIEAGEIYASLVKKEKQWN